jgi:hypothetical protein
VDQATLMAENRAKEFRLPRDGNIKTSKDFSLMPMQQTVQAPTLDILINPSVKVAPMVRVQP